MSLKSAIKQAITANSKKYRAVKVWKIEESEDFAEHVTLFIEVTVVKKKPVNRLKNK